MSTMKFSRHFFIASTTFGRFLAPVGSFTGARRGSDRKATSTSGTKNSAQKFQKKNETH